jgi:FKBP-type peptidyl-prolyl cis-trans isomerase
MDSKKIGGVILVLGLAALIFLNFNSMSNARYNNSSNDSSDNSGSNTLLDSRLKDQSRENLPTQTERWGELSYDISLEGSGDRVVETGDKITVNYIGWLASNGEIFDTSFNEGRTPFQFTVGSGVIEGWSSGVVGMKLGEVRRLKIPSDQAYGESGQGSIEPNSDLFFDVELLGIN